MQESVNKMSLDNLLDQKLPDFAKHARETDVKREFVSENYMALKKMKFFSALIPETLGGMGVTHKKMCNHLQTIARYCGSTALALSMHQHLIAVQVWKYHQGDGNITFLENIAQQELILAGSGAVDWMTSSGTMKKVSGGYLVNGLKRFASNAAAADLFLTSAPWKNQAGEPRILHFPLPLTADGVTIEEDWDTLGMRGTGSNSVRMSKVYIPDNAIMLDRPYGDYHATWNVILPVAMPFIMSVYVGIAEAAAEIATNLMLRKTITDSQKDLLGEMTNQLINAQILLASMLEICNNYDFQPLKELAHQVLVRKTLITKSVIQTVELGMSLCGGAGYMTGTGLERCFRDIQAARYHPLPAKSQHLFSANHLLEQQRQSKLSAAG